MFVIDDALLLGVLSERPRPQLAPYVEAAARGEIYTTSSWYWRLSRALSHQGGGALSRRFQALDDARQRRVMSAMAELPPRIGLLESRILVPVMAALPGQLNMLTAEAVAAAVLLDAAIAVSIESNLLSEAATSVGVSIQLVRSDP